MANSRHGQLSDDGLEVHPLLGRLADIARAGGDGRESPKATWKVVRKPTYGESRCESAQHSSMRNRIRRRITYSIYANCNEGLPWQTIETKKQRPF